MLSPIEIFIGIMNISFPFHWFEIVYILHNYHIRETVMPVQLWETCKLTCIQNYLQKPLSLRSLVVAE
jgi:hypothetical protein